MAQALAQDGLDQQHEGKYLTFAIGRETYGINIMAIREIVGIAGLEVHEVPNIPEYAKGVINLRGKVIPIISLRLRFGMEESDYSERTCIVVVDIPRDSGGLLMGVVVDSVSEVMNVQARDIEPPPQFGAGLDSEFILGMAKAGDEVNVLLDIARVLSVEELKSLKFVC